MILDYQCRCPVPHKLAGPDADEADAYVRLSFDKRKGREGEGLAVERQLEEICYMAGEVWNLRIRRVWVDNDKSATSGKPRPDFEDMLRAQPKRIAVWHTDRLVRLTKELERVIEIKSDVHAVKAGFFDLSHPGGRATAKTITAWAQYEGEIKSERQKSESIQRARNGEAHWSTRPFGFNMDKTHNKKEAKALRQVYADFITGKKNLSELCRWLNDEGFTTTLGNPWRTPALRFALEAARNAGIRTLHGEEIGQGKWDEIVPEEIWRATVYKLSDPLRRTNPYGGRIPRNLLTQIATCGVCGAGVKVRTVGRKGRTNDRYYSCASNDKGHVAHEVEWADGVVLRRVNEAMSDPEFHANWSQAPVADPEEIEALRVEESALRERIKDLDNRWSLGKVSEDRYDAMTKTMETRIEEIKNELAGLGSQSVLTATLADLELGWQEMDDMELPDLRQFVSMVLESITLLPMGRGARTRKQEKIETVRRSSVTNAVAA